MRERLSRLSEQTPDRAVIELRMDLKRLRNDLASALARWPHHPELRDLARRVGVKA